MSVFQAARRFLSTAIPAIHLVTTPVQAQQDTSHALEHFFTRPHIINGNCYFHSASTDNPFNLVVVALKPESLPPKPSGLPKQSEDTIFLKGSEEYTFRNNMIFRPTGTRALDIKPSLRQIINDYARELLSSCYVWTGREALRQTVRPPANIVG